MRACQGAVRAQRLCGERSRAANFQHYYLVRGCVVCEGEQVQRSCAHSPLVSQLYILENTVVNV